jgi:hypothetical protein
LRHRSLRQPGGFEGRFGVEELTPAMDPALTHLEDVISRLKLAPRARRLARTPSPMTLPRRSDERQPLVQAQIETPRISAGRLGVQGGENCNAPRGQAGFGLAMGFLDR